MSAVLFEPLWRGANWLYGYYISFDETGVSVVDNVLAAIADAGKAYHNTIDWNNEPYDRTESCVDSIQRMAGLAAERFSELENENERLKLETAEARREARLDERKAIVAHLRAEAATSSLSSCQNEWRLAARAIEDGSHMQREDDERTHTRGVYDQVRCSNGHTFVPVSNTSPCEHCAAIKAREDAP